MKSSDVVALTRQFIDSMTWTDATPPEVRQLVVDNVRGFGILVFVKLQDEEMKGRVRRRNCLACGKPLDGRTRYDQNLIDRPYHQACFERLKPEATSG